MRLSARLDSALQSGESAFAQANGSQYFHVTGECEFWSNNHSWFTHHGSATEEDVRAIAEALSYGEVPNGRWSTDNCFDGSTLTVNDVANTLECVCDCENGPPEARNAANSFTALLEHLGGRHEAWSGPLEALLLEADYLEDSVAVNWPSGLALMDFLVPLEDARALLMAGQDLEGVRVDGEQSSVLRAMIRDFSLLRPDGGWIGDPIAVRHDDATYAFFFHDVFPVP